MDEVLQRYNVTVEHGLTTDEAEARRESAGHYNTVDPPVQCPAWICCLLPCIKHIPSMKAYKQIAAEDAEVRRNGQWIRYDASSLVQGDIIRLEEGDIVPADCLVLFLEPGCSELLVDHRLVTGQEKPVSARATSNSRHMSSSSNEPPGVSGLVGIELFWGARVVLGSCMAICTAVGPQTTVARLIALKRFPATVESFAATFGSGADVVGSDNAANDEEAGMLLVRTSNAPS
jgi:E1-E2 ATPase/Cation transporter/ATPase, N-terminus